MSQSKYELAYLNLLALIEQRQAFEKEHNYPPYTSFPTPIYFSDIKNKTLFDYAVLMGDLEKLREIYCRSCEEIIKLDFKEIEYKKLKKAALAAFSLALGTNHLSLIQYLFDIDLDYTKIALSQCVYQEVRLWFKEIIRLSLKDANTSSFQSSYYDVKTKMKRAAEIGDVELINTLLDGINNPNDRLKIIQTSLIKAAENGELTVVKLLYASASNGFTEKFQRSPLIAAIEFNQWEVIHFFLSVEMDLNRQDNYKYSPLGAAVLKNNLPLIELLLNQEVNVTHVTVKGNTILHLAIYSQPLIVERLLMHPVIKALRKEKNIFGQSPLDLAMAEKKDAIIKLLIPNADLKAVRKNARYGKGLIEISQSRILDKMHYFLKIMYRDTRFFGLNGSCNGFNFKNLLHSKAYFMTSLKRIALWDGKHHSLFEPFKDIPQAHFFENLYDLIDAWINEIIWFQHTFSNGVEAELLNRVERFKYHDQARLISLLEQTNRKEQFSIVKSDITQQFFDLYGEEKLFFRNYLQIVEIISYLIRMPINTKFEFDFGDYHVGSAAITENKLFIYYDSNFPHKTQDTLDCHKIAQRIVDFGFILFKKHENVYPFKFSISYLETQGIAFDHKGFEIFSKNELPQNFTQSIYFQTCSANGFSQLHIAVITRSLASIKKLLEYSDVNAKDSFGRTPLQIASENDFSEAITLFLKIPHVSINYVTLLLDAIRYKDLQIIKMLLPSKHIDLETAPFLLRAIEANHDETIDYLLTLGAKLTTRFGSNSALQQAMQKTSGCTNKIISHLKDPDTFDEIGFNALHYAAECYNTSAVLQLIAKGADVNLRSKTINKRSILMYFRVSLNADAKACLDVILLHYNFNLRDKNTVKLFMFFLEECVTHSDAIFQTLMNKASAEVLADKNYSLILLNLMIQTKQFTKIPYLIKAILSMNSCCASINIVLIQILEVENFPGRYELINLLLIQHDDFAIKNSSGKTLAQIAEESEDEALKSIFANHLNKKAQEKCKFFRPAIIEYPASCSFGLELTPSK